MIIDLTLLFNFWIPENDILLFAMCLGAFGLVAVSSLSLTFKLWVPQPQGWRFLWVLSNIQSCPLLISRG